MGKSGKVIAGIGLIVGGALVGIFTGQWTIAFTLASTGVGILTQPKVPSNLGGQQGAVLDNRVGADQPIPLIYGTTQIAGVLCDLRVHDASTQRKRLVVVTAWCHGSRDGSGISGIDELWFDNTRAILGSALQTPYSTVVAGESPTIHHLEYAHHLGDTAQAVDSRLSTLFPVEWPSTARGKGVCYSRFELWFNQDVYAGGIPTMQAKIRGNKVYDTRTTTWIHSNNPSMCIRDYLLSTVYGLGLDAANLEEQSFIDMANHCDELVSIPGGGTQARYTLDGWVDTTRSVEENLALLCTSCRAQIVNEGDKWRIIIRRARSSTGFKVTAHNTVEGSWQYLLPGSNSAPNVGRAHYIDPSKGYAADTVQFPEPGGENAFLDDDNSYEQRIETDLPFTNNRLRAQQIVMTQVKESRQGIGVTVTLKEEALKVRVGDIVDVSYETPGWVDKPFDVAALLLQQDGDVQAVLAEYEPTTYDLDVQFPQPSVPDSNLPNPFLATNATSLVLTSLGQALQTNDGRYIPRIRVTYAKANNPFVDYYEIQAKKTADASWDSFGRIGALDTPIFFVTPVTDESWDVRIRSVNTIGVRSVWLSATHVVSTPDPRPQILSITLTNAHTDVGHTDSHTDAAHGDAGHADGHSDTAHTDHTDHSDAHSDTGGHDDVAHVDSHGDVGDIDTDHTDTHSDSDHSDHSDGHGDTHSDSNHQDTAHDDSHGDIGAIDTDHTDIHSDNAHHDHSDSALAHSDTAHADTHSDTEHSDSPHADGHTDSAHGDGQYGIGIAIQADTDSASVRAIARKHGDHADGSHTDVTEPTVVETRTGVIHNGRNVVIELIDVATGAQMVMNPGDHVRVGALAYADVAGAGVEGPLALASVSLFQASVAPVGTDQWWPS